MLTPYTFTTTMQKDFEATLFLKILIVSSITFVAYEGFQLVINAVNEMENPTINIPKAIYWAIVLNATFWFKPFIIILGWS